MVCGVFAEVAVRNRFGVLAGVFGSNLAVKPSPCTVVLGPFGDTVKTNRFVPSAALRVWSPAASNATAQTSPVWPFTNPSRVAFGLSPRNSTHSAHPDCSPIRMSVSGSSATSSNRGVPASTVRTYNWLGIIDGNPSGSRASKSNVNEPGTLTGLVGTNPGRTIRKLGGSLPANIATTSRGDHSPWLSRARSVSRRRSGTR